MAEKPWKPTTNNWTPKKPTFFNTLHKVFVTQYSTGVAIRDSATDKLKAPITAIAKGFNLSDSAPTP